MRPISEMIPDVSLAASGAPNFLVLHALGRATATFLYRSEAWKEWSIDVDTDDIDDSEYTWLNHLNPAAVDADDYLWLRVKRVRAIEWGDLGTIYPTTPSKAAERDPQWRTTTGQPRGFVSLSDEGGGVRFVPVPAAPLPATMRAHLVMITEVTTGIGSTGLASQVPSLPDRVLRKYRDTIVSGALAILYALPKRDWSDPSLALYHRDAFERGIVAAESSAARDENHVQFTTAFNPDW